MKKVEI